jgi:hypothetical protein
VIRAKSELAARELAAEQAGDEGPDAWLSALTASCVELHTEGDAEAIMQDYNPAAVGRAGRHQIDQRVDQSHQFAGRH